MTDDYNKNKWSCIVGDNFGSFIWKYVAYNYDYGGFKWTVFLGASNGA